MSSATFPPVSSRPDAAVWLWFGLLFAVMAVAALLTPLLADDYFFRSAPAQPFSEVMSGESVRPLEPARFGDMFRRAMQMYATWDGRFLSYLVIGLALWLPPAATAAGVALTVCLTVFLALLHVLGPDWRRCLRWWHVPLMASLLCWGMPTCGSVWFWHTGLGYAADLCGALLFLLPFRFLLERSDLCVRPVLSPVAAAVWPVLGFCLGLLQYNTPLICLVGGTAALCVLWFRHAALPPGERLRRLLPLIAALVALALALAVLFASPGNAARLRLQEGWFLTLTLPEKAALFLRRQPQAQALFWLPWLLAIWAAVLLALRHGRAFWKHVPLAGAAFLLLGQMGQGAFLFSPAPAPRAFTSAVVFMLLGACIVLRAALATAGTRAVRAQRVCGLIFCLLFWALLPYELWHVARGRAELDARDRMLEEARGTDARVPPLVMRGRLFFPLGAYVQDMAHDPAFWINRVVAAYWGLPSVALRLPPDRYFLYEEKESRVLLRLRGENLSVVAWPEGVARALYVYYAAHSSFLARLPQPLGDALTGWIARAGSGDCRLLASPLLFSITHLPPDSPRQRLWGLFNGGRFPLWLVRPGDGPASFRILPLRELDRNEASRRFPDLVPSVSPEEAS